MYEVWSIFLASWNRSFGSLSEDSIPRTKVMLNNNQQINKQSRESSPSPLGEGLGRGRQKDRYPERAEG